jgi:hypothetical protein
MTLTREGARGFTDVVGEGCHLHQYLVKTPNPEPHTSARLSCSAQPIVCLRKAPVFLLRSAPCHQSPSLRPMPSKPVVLASALEMAASPGIPTPSVSLDASQLPLPAPAKDTCQEGSKRVRKNCAHGKYQPYCKQCRGSMLCEHLRHKNRCAICKRSAKATNSGATINFAIRVETVGPEVGSTLAVKLFLQMLDGQQWKVETIPLVIDALHASAPVP